MNEAFTLGAHHIGLTTPDLERTADFFTRLLGWKEVKRDASYPAIFVSDGNIMITLWALKEIPGVPFDRRKNAGLHHLALRVKDETALNDVYEKLKADGIEIEFSPEFIRQGPARHMMCYEPGGIRIEFIWPAT